MKYHDNVECKRLARETIKELTSVILEVSHDIHANPELGFEEHFAAERLTKLLEEHDFQVTRNVADIETAFMASAGHGRPHIAICAEYDALPEIGHACGHNIIAASALGAGIALAKIAETHGFTVTVFGTPAEEGGGGKVVMAESGAFSDVDAAMMIHPAPIDIAEPPMLAVATFKVAYKGKPSHASAAPQLGINALDAMHVAYTAISCLRQQLSPTDRIHGIIENGGDAPNVIPARTSATYYVRARSAAELKELSKRVTACFEAGAIATGCQLEMNTGVPVYHEVLHNRTMAELYRANLESIGRSPLQRDLIDPKYAGSTDMGNISYLVPSIHPMIGINSLPAINHQPEFAKHCVSKSGDRAVVDGAIALAWTTLDLALDESKMKDVLEEFTRTKYRISDEAFTNQAGAS